MRTELSVNCNVYLFKKRWILSKNDKFYLNFYSQCIGISLYNFKMLYNTNVTMKSRGLVSTRI